MSASGFFVFFFFNLHIVSNLLTMIAGTSSRDITVQDRLRGAVWGQFVGDASALGAHWIYDLRELSAKFPGGVVGFETPQPGHYHEGRKPGDQTHYGDGALVLLESIAEVGGFDARAFGKRFVDTFGSPNYRGYLDHATKGTLENYRRFCESNPPDRFDFQQALTTTNWPAARASPAWWPATGGNPTYLTWWKWRPKFVRTRQGQSGT